MIIRRYIELQEFDVFSIIWRIWYIYIISSTIAVSS